MEKIVGAGGRHLLLLHSLDALGLDALGDPEVGKYSGIRLLLQRAVEQRQYG